MTVDYDLVCRRDALGPLLAALSLARRGCRVLLLPGRGATGPEPEFLLPVLRGYPAELLEQLVGLENVPERVLTWTPPDANTACLALGSGCFATPLEDSPAELEQLWRLINDCMRRNLEMPVNSLGGTGRILWLVVKNQRLRENRSLRLSHWLEASGIEAGEQVFWRSLTPLVTLSRFADPPLLAYAYGVSVLARAQGWLALAGMKARLVDRLRCYGADCSDQDWDPVFDGKWYIGVGKNRQPARRSTVFLADSDPLNLRLEVAAGDQRFDFKRQMELADPGFVVYKEKVTGIRTGEIAPYHLDCTGARDFSRALLVAAGERGNDGPVAYRFRPARAAGAADPGGGERNWGWEPRLPAMMGGGFLPLARGFRRFYQVGWHNLPGFGFGGLVYSAHQAAVRVWTHDLQKDAEKFSLVAGEGTVDGKVG